MKTTRQQKQDLRKQCQELDAEAERILNWMDGQLDMSSHSETLRYAIGLRKITRRLGVTTLRDQRSRRSGNLAELRAYATNYGWTNSGDQS